MLTVVTSWNSTEEEQDLKKLAGPNIEIRARRLPSWRPVWNCVWALPGRLPLQAAWSWHPGMAREIRELAGNSFDVVHVEHLRGALFGLEVKAPGRLNGDSGPAVVWDSVDCISHLFQQAAEQSRSLKGRWMTRLELGRTRRFEGWLAGQFDHTTATSPADREALLKLAYDRHDFKAGSRISVLPNGVDLDYFRPGCGPRDNDTVVFSGKMSYHANVTAALHLLQKIMPKVWNYRPDVKVVIAGKNPPKSLLTAAASCGGRVEVTGTVPDIRPYLGRAAVAVAPLVYGAGIQNKVLEAMACGTPVVTSRKVLSALKARPGRDLAVAESATGIALELLGLLADARRREAMGRAGRAYVESHHNWHQIGVQLEGIYRETLERRKGTRAAAKGA
jgi:glycosyltransferase involved in cell wall biosynthesis